MRPFFLYYLIYARKFFYKMIACVCEDFKFLKLFFSEIFKREVWNIYRKVNPKEKSMEEVKTVLTTYQLGHMWEDRIFLALFEEVFDYDDAKYHYIWTKAHHPDKYKHLTIRKKTVRCRTTTKYDYDKNDCLN